MKRFLPFGDGPRKCVGYALAKLNYTTAVAVLLSNFTFRLADQARPAPTSFPLFLQRPPAEALLRAAAEQCEACASLLPLPVSVEQWSAVVQLTCPCP